MVVSSATLPTEARRVGGSPVPPNEVPPNRNGLSGSVGPDARDPDGQSNHTETCEHAQHEADHIPGRRFLELETAVREQLSLFQLFAVMLVPLMYLT